MARIVPKLNLNKTPQSVDNNSFIFAKNIRLLKDNTIGRDTGIDKVDFSEVDELSGFKLVGYIPYNTKVYLFFYSETSGSSVIYEYDEQKALISSQNSFTKCNTGWKYSGGIIEGIVTVNLRNDTLLTINEYFEDYVEGENSLIPIKTINLNESKEDDDESIYSNAPIIPILNLITLGTYSNTIPNGTYQFFVRYEIVEGYYTNWFPCSGELFTANIYDSDTAQGSVRYMDTLLNSNESFKFSVDKLNSNFDNIYKSFQIGYIISHDDVVKAKAWKHFPMDTTHIYFDYAPEYTTDIEISDIIRPVLNLYNVKNLTSFKSKFYISNYIESDYNKSNIVDLVKKWNVSYDIKYIENIGTYLYQSMAANHKTITYTDGNNDEQADKDIITSFSNFNNIKQIIDNRNEFLVYPSEETNINLVDTTTNVIVQEYNGSSSVTVHIAYEDAVGIPPKNPSGSTEKNNMRRWFNRRYCNIYESDITYDFYSLIRIAVIRNDDDDLHYTTASSVDRENCMFDEYALWWDYNTGNKVIFKDSTNGRNFVRETISSCIEGFLAQDVSTDKGKSIVNYINSDDNRVTQITNKYREFYMAFRLNDVIYDQNYTPNNDGKHYYYFTVDIKDCYRDCSYSLIPADISMGTSFEKSNVKTLIPFQSYNFYIHFVKDTGEITNGYLIDTYTQEYIEDCKNHVQLIPKFVYNNNNNTYSNYKEILENYGYKYYFFSVAKVAKTVAELINKSLFAQDDGENYSTMFDCLDVDTMQLPLVSDIPIYEVVREDYNKTDIHTVNRKYIGKYIDSGQLEPKYSRLFGASGKVVPDTELDNVIDAQYFIVLDTEANTDILDLIKCTKYFKINDSSEIVDNKLEVIDVDANLQDYICTVAKKVENEISKFISSSDYFEKDVLEVEAGESPKYTVVLDDINDFMPYVHTGTQLIYSNFNLNFLSLTNDIKRLIRKYESYQIDENGDYEYDSGGQKIVADKGRQLTASFDSLTLSDLYTFPKMYKDYTRRYFDVYSEGSMVVYNNTIRCSELEGDEVKTFVYKFLAEVTYNIPTDKGKIVNLVSVGDAVIVHTQDSIYKFTGKVTLSSADSNVQTVESDIFDTGIQEIVGSKYGFAGLRNKYNSLMTQFGYIFWDADVNVIYAYTGEGQMAPISDPINKVLNYKPISDIRFCEDYYNDRFFMQITYIDDNIYDEDIKNKLLLSYNIKAKAFVSLHDFAFDKTFNTKTNTYFIKNNLLYKLSNKTVGYNDLYTTDSVYPTYIFDTKQDKYKKPAAVIDIIFNAEYEFIKVLDSISWICSEIDSTHIAPTTEGYLFLAEETLNRNYPGNKLRIYTDSCSTDLIDIVKSSNAYDLYKQLITHSDPEEYEEVDALDKTKTHNITNNISESYKFPRYNLGKWSFNYFRDILNVVGPHNTGVSDNSSLLYGKYFIFRFIFDCDVNFKFENLSININNNYGNN